LMTELTEHTDLLNAIARTVAPYQNDPVTQRDTLKGASNRLAVFDAGVMLLDTFGMVVAAEPERPALLGQDWSNRTYYRQILHSQTLGSSAPVFSDIVADGPDRVEVIVVAVPITGEQGEFLGILAGMFRVGATSISAFYGDIVKMHIGESGSTYLLDGSGRVIYHSDADRIGEDFSTQAVAQQVLSGQVGAIRTRGLENQDIVAAFAPLPGTSWGLVTEESWAALTSGSQGYQRFLTLMLLLGVVVPVLVVAIGVRQITRPIRELIGAAQAVARGNFGRTITAQTGDEIAELAEQFNLMSDQLQASYAHLEQRVADRTKELAALNAIATVVSRSLDLQEVLGNALDKTLEVTGLKAGGIYLLQEDAGVLTIAAHKGLSPGFVAEIDDLAVGEGFSGRVVQTGEPLVVRDLSTDPRLTRSAVREGKIHSAAIFPLISPGKVLGSLFLITRDYHEFSPQDIDLLSSIGRQVGVAVENAQLYEQAQELAVVAERQRLARDLHDAVTQTLFSASLIAEVLPRLWERDPEEGRQRLEEVRQLTRGALAEMRTLLLELRPAALTEAELSDLLRQLAEATTGRARVMVTVDVEGERSLPPDVKVALYRIAQEALNNVAKHAGASQATVSLRCGPDAVELQVSDDGHGFDLDKVPPEHLGLRIMRERAEVIDAKLEIESQAGQGTRVAVVWEDKGRKRASKS
jgi:nitrate/nitrite-specific signal transduction histidine kinase